MSSLLTNTSAMTALTTLKSIAGQLDQTSSRISTGLKVGNASDNAAYWSIATTIRADNGSLGAVKDALGLGAASVDTAFNGMNSAIEDMKSIQAKLTAAMSPNVDRGKIQTEINSILSKMKSTADSSVVSGENWLSTDSGAGNYVSDRKVVASFTRIDGAITVDTVNVSVDATKLYDKTTASFTPTTAAQTAYDNAKTAYDNAAGAYKAADAVAFAKATPTTTFTTNKAAFDTALAGWDGTSAAPPGIATAITALGAADATPGYAVTAKYVYEAVQAKLAAVGASADASLTTLANTTTASYKGTKVGAYELAKADLSAAAKTAGIGFNADVSRDKAVFGDAEATWTTAQADWEASSKDATAKATFDAAKVTYDTAKTTYGKAIETANGLAVASADGQGGTLNKSMGILAKDEDGALKNYELTVDTLDISAIQNQDLSKLRGYIALVDKALSAMTDAATTLGANKTQITSQTTFVESLIKANERSIGTLVDADMEEESTRLKALQVQQQLGVQSLSIANGSTQNILSLFR